MLPGVPRGRGTPLQHDDPTAGRLPQLEEAVRRREADHERLWRRATRAEAALSGAWAEAAAERQRAAELERRYAALRARRSVRLALRLSTLARPLFRLARRGRPGA